MKFPLGVQGQVQLLTASVLGAVMLAGALSALEYSQKTTHSSIRGTRRTEMRMALEAAIRKAHYLYQESACDPVILNKKLSRINEDGTLPTSSTDYDHRQLVVNVGDHTYRVALGPISTISWLASTDTSLATHTEGISQDAILEVWTSFNGQRLIQRAVLINNCTFPCSATDESIGCLTSADRAIAFHRITDPGKFPTSSTSVGSCFPGSSSLGSRYTGDLNTDDASCIGTVDGIIDLRDLKILRNYLRSGDTVGSCSSMIGGSGALCADLNSDSLVNENDLTVFEKVLRGYLYYIPVR